MKGRLVVLSGPSGVGKDTLIDAWAAADPRVRRVVAATTRRPRKGERDGVDYRFLSKEEFHALRKDGAFLEAKKVHGNWYATPKDQVERLLAEGKVTVLKIDVQGALEVRKLREDARLVFVMPPSLAELERRLRARRTESPARMRKRLLVARHEMGRAKRYDAVVVNDELPRAVAELRKAADG